jgi:hypothetical protein
MTIFENYIHEAQCVKSFWKIQVGYVNQSGLLQIVNQNQTTYMQWNLILQ